MIPGVMLWVGPAGAMTFLMGMAICGGVLALLVLAARHLTPVRATNGFSIETLQQGNGVPYGVAIAAGAIMASPASPLLSGLAAQFGWAN